MKLDTIRKVLEEAAVDSMSGLEFEQYIGKLLTHRGFRVWMRGGSHDLGVDIVAQRGGVKYSVQIKRYAMKSKVSRRAVSDAVAGKEYYDCDEAMVITSSHFSREAKNLARRTGCRLVDRNILAGWILDFRSEIPPILASINQATADELVSLLGISPPAAQRIVNYRKARGVFVSIEEFKHIAGDTVLLRLRMSRDPININAAPPEMLRLLPGIGRTCAKRIVAYREEQGPFASIKELNQVSGISEGTFQRLKNMIIARTQPININTAPVWKLRSLPGIDPTCADCIAEYRAEKGPFTSIKELKEVPGIGEVTVQRLIDMNVAPVEIDDLLGFGDIALDSGQYERAKEYYERALKLDASNKEAIERLARIDEVLSRKKAEEIDDVLGFGDIAFDLGQYERAKEYYERALELDASNQEAIEALARIDEILNPKKAMATEPRQVEPVEPPREPELTYRTRRMKAVSVIIAIIAIISWIALGGCGGFLVGILLLAAAVLVWKGVLAKWKKGRERAIKSTRSGQEKKIQSYTA